MAYIGLEPSNSFVSLKRQVITGDGTASYTLDHSVASVNDVAIFVNNVRQDPAGYSISGAALTLGGTIESSDDCYVIFLGQALQTVTPGGATITGSMLNNSLISDKTALSAAPADTDEFLISDAGTLKRIDYSLIKATNTPMILAVSNTSQTVSDSTTTKVTSLNTQPINTGGTWDSSNHRWTPGVAGTYFLAGQTSININNAGSYLQAMVYKNGSVISYNQVTAEGTNATYISQACIIDTADTDDYYELYIRHNTGGNSTINYDTAYKYTNFFGYKLT